MEEQILNAINKCVEEGQSYNTIISFEDLTAKDTELLDMDFFKLRDELRKLGYPVEELQGFDFVSSVKRDREEFKDLLFKYEDELFPGTIHDLTEELKKLLNEVFIGDIETTFESRMLPPNTTAKDIHVKFPEVIITKENKLTIDDAKEYIYYWGKPDKLYAIQIGYRGEWLIGGFLTKEMSESFKESLSLLERKANSCVGMLNELIELMKQEKCNEKDIDAITEAAKIIATYTTSYKN